MSHLTESAESVEVSPGVTLTSREREVLRCLATGNTARAMGRQLGVSELTVRKHLEHTYAKMGVHDRLDAVLVALRAGII